MNSNQFVIEQSIITLKSSYGLRNPQTVIKFVINKLTIIISSIFRFSLWNVIQFSSNVYGNQ